MNEFWNARYSREEYVYGTKPNEFFKEQIDKLNAGRLLLLGEGEGRNAVYAAKYNWHVDAVDFSNEAKKKALKLAGKNNVVINYTLSTLEDFKPQESFYDAIGLIFIHMNNDVSRLVHSRCIDALKPDGVIILEAFEKEQVRYKSGGPQNSDLLYTIEDIRLQFKELKTTVLAKEIVNINEGAYHSGEAAVIKFTGIK